MSDFIHVTTGKDYEKITNINGVQTTVCANRLEIMCKPTAELHEEQILQAVREWVRWRNEKMLSQSGDMPK